LQFSRVFAAFLAVRDFLSHHRLRDNSGGTLVHHLVAEFAFMAFFKTPAVADLIGVSYYRLIGLLRSRRLAPPQKDTSGDYIWTPEDIEGARKALSGHLPDGRVATSVNSDDPETEVGRTRPSVGRRRVSDAFITADLLLADFGLAPSDVRLRYPHAVEYTALDGQLCWRREDLSSPLVDSAEDDTP
jgi:hypothetical protein